MCTKIFLCKIFRCNNGRVAELYAGASLCLTGTIGRTRHYFWLINTHVKYRTHILHKPTPNCTQLNMQYLRIRLRARDFYEVTGAI